MKKTNVVRPEAVGTSQETSTLPGTQTLARGLEVLAAVSAGASDLRDIGEHLGTSRSTTHRLVSFLLSTGWLRQFEGRGISLGPRLIEMGTLALDQIPLAALARPHLQALARQTGDTIHLGIQDGHDVLYLEKIPGTKGLEMRSRPGYRMPLACTGVGKALMLDMPETQWREHYDRAIAIVRSMPVVPPGVIEWDEYARAMRAFSAAGHAVDLEENEAGIRCVSAPIRDARKGVAGAISVATTVPYMPLDRIEQLIPIVRECAQRISRELGWTRS